MGQSSQAGQVGFGIQGVKGTAVAATRFMKTRGGSMGPERSLLIPDPEIGGHRDVANAYLGSVAFSGDYDFYPRLQSVAILLFAALGTRSSTNDAGPPLVGTHVITPGNTLPWLTVEESIGASLATFRYTDVRVNTLRLEAEASGYLMGSANMIGLKGESGFTRQVSPTFDDTPMIIGQSITFSFGGNDLRARSFSLEINNNIENDDFRLGSMELGDAVEKRREIKMTASYRPDDATLWKQAMWGAGNVDVPQAGPAYRGPATISFSSYEKIGGGLTSYSLDVDIPHAVIEPFKVTPQGDDVISTDINIQAIRPVTATPIATVTVVNDLATIS